MRLYQRTLGFLLSVSCFLCVLCVTEAFAQEARLTSPEQVARGDAFLVSVLSPTPVPSVKFTWRGKQYTVSSIPWEKGSKADILLGTPVDKNEGKSLPLVAILSNGKKLQSKIGIYDKERPVQKLTVDRKYVSPSAKELERIRSDQKKSAAAAATFSAERHWSLPMYRPLTGGVSSVFGVKRVFNGEPRSVHKGLDLRGAEGTPIKAAAGGTVLLSDDLYFSGNVVYIDHGQGVVTMYAHLSKSLVKPGQYVARGETLGLVGATGRVTGPHLHLTLLVQGVPVDPFPLLEATQGSTK